MLNRIISLYKIVESQKVTIVYGPRQVGKTTLVEEYLKEYKGNYKFFTGDDIEFAADFSQSNLNFLRNLLEGVDLLVIDEAQLIENIGRATKLAIDNIKPLQIILTGSASFDLASKTAEPLTGRKNTITLFPLSYIELEQNYGKYEISKELENLMIYGSYPEIVTTIGFDFKQRRLKELTNSYLLKDILQFDLVKNSKTIWDLLKLLAFQIGDEVSQSELASKLGIDTKTVGRYLDLLEKTFVLYRLDGFSKNLRNEITKTSKYFFYDLGIRNALISNFNQLDTRNDVGAMWENYVIIEKIKSDSYNHKSANYYFWRTYEQQEIDFIIEAGGGLQAIEIKWNSKKQQKVPNIWTKTYPEAQYHIINPENFRDFLS